MVCCPSCLRTATAETWVAKTFVNALARWGQSGDDCFPRRSSRLATWDLSLSLYSLAPVVIMGFSVLREDRNVHLRMTERKVSQALCAKDCVNSGLVEWMHRSIMRMEAGRIDTRCGCLLIREMSLDGVLAKRYFYACKKASGLPLMQFLRQGLSKGCVSQRKKRKALSCGLMCSDTCVVVSSLLHKCCLWRPAFLLVQLHVAPTQGESVNRFTGYANHNEIHVGHSTLSTRFARSCRFFDSRCFYGTYL